MATVALILSGSELHRQPYADVVSFVGSALEEPSPLLHEFDPPRLAVYADDEVDHLLNGVDKRAHACLVFASNSLMSAAVADAVARHDEDLREYMRAGGGIVMLHQIRDVATPFLAGELRCTTQRTTGDRGTIDERVTPVGDGDDLLLNYPSPIVDEGGTRVTWADTKRQNPHRLFWTHIPRESTGSLVPVLQGSRAKDIVLARTRANSGLRVVVSTIPLDWHEQRGLLRNAISFGMSGAPTTLVWDAEGSSGLAVRTLAHDRHAVVRGDEGPPSSRDRWLLGEVELCVVARETLEGVTAPTAAPSADVSQVMTDFLTGGGTLAATAPSDELAGVADLRALVGPHIGRQLVEGLLDALAAATEWGEAADAPAAEPFALRNVVAARRQAEQLFPRRVVPPLSQAKHRVLLEVCLSEMRKTHDVGSAIARAETLALLGAHADALVRAERILGAFMETAGPDLELQARAAQLVLASARGATVDDDLTDLLVKVVHRAGNTRSLPELVRLCAAVGSVRSAGSGTDPEVAAKAGRTLADALRRRLAVDDAPAATTRPPGTIAWPSIEAVAEVVRGLVFLHEAADDADRLLLETVADCAVLLRRAHNDWSDERQGLGLLARIVDALLAVERAFPEGVGRLALAPPQLGGTGGRPRGWPPVVASGGAEAAMRLHNEQLREELRALQARAAELETAAQVGRWSAAVLLVALMLAPVAVVVWLVEEKTGADAVGVAVAVGLALITAAWRVGVALRDRGLLPAQAPGGRG